MPNDMDTAFSRPTPDENQAPVNALGASVDSNGAFSLNDDTPGAPGTDASTAFDDHGGERWLSSIDPVANEEELNAREVIARRNLADRYGSGDRVSHSYAHLLTVGRDYANATLLLLTAVMQLYLDMTDQSDAVTMINTACEDAGINFTKRTDLIQKLIRLAINDAEPTGEDGASKDDPGKHETTVQKLANLYARVIRFALHHGVPPKQLPRFVAAQGGLKGCVGRYAALIRKRQDQDVEGSTSTPKKKTMKVTWENSALEALATIDQRGDEEIECMIVFKRQAPGHYKIQKIEV